MIGCWLVPSSVKRAPEMRPASLCSSRLHRKKHSSPTSPAFEHWCKATPIKPTHLAQPPSRHHQLSWLSLTNRTVCCPPLDAISTVRFSSCLPVIFTGLHSSSSSPVPSCMLVPIPQEYTEPGTNATMRKCRGETITLLEPSARFTAARYLEHVWRG